MSEEKTISIKLDQLESVATMKRKAETALLICKKNEQDKIASGMYEWCQTDHKTLILKRKHTT